MSSQLGVDGIVSGIDTQQIISQLMRLERQPVVRLQQTRAQHSRSDDAWAQIATKLQGLRTAADDIARASNVTAGASVTSSDESAVAVSPIEGAQVEPGATSLSVQQLATGSQQASLAEFTSPDDVIGAGTMTLRIAGQDIEIETVANATVKDLTNLINEMDQGARAQILKVGEDRFRLVITSRKTGTSQEVSVVGDHAGVGAMETTQAAQDAVIDIGGITVSRSSNQIDDLVDGVSLDLRQAGTGPVTIGVDRDFDAVSEKVSALVDAMNSALTTVGDLGRAARDPESRGPLSGDATVRSIATQIRDTVANGVVTSDGLRSLGDLGIELTRDGAVTFDADRLRDSLANDFDGTVSLLSRSAAADGAYLANASVTSGTATGSYDVVVTQAATKAFASSAGYTAPTVDETVTISTDYGSVDVLITAGTSRDDAVIAINDALAAEGLALEARADGAGVAIEATRFGTRDTFETTGAAALFGGELSGTGQDVQGTIDGVAATGTGRRLQSSDGDSNGLSVEVTIDPATLAAAGGSMTLGTVGASEGFGGTVAGLMSELAGPDGVVDRARARIDRRISAVDDRIVQFENRLEVRERTLMRQFTAMEQAMARLMDQGQWLSSQLPQVPQS